MTSLVKGPAKKKQMTSAAARSGSANENEGHAPLVSPLSAPVRSDTPPLEASAGAGAGTGGDVTPISTPPSSTIPLPFFVPTPGRATPPSTPGPTAAVAPAPAAASPGTTAAGTPGNGTLRRRRGLGGNLTRTQTFGQL
ncbi:hypothetical protein AX16_003567 [Volvariella volvacea WC 439]|nr:hypothetical protein AX16_003567 [Volvariella volvacea WC 439]